MMFQNSYIHGFDTVFLVDDIHGFSIDLLERNEELVKYEHGWNTLTDALGIPDDQAEQLLNNINQGR